MACAAILIDAEYNNCLVDDRPEHPVPDHAMDKLFEDAEVVLKRMAESHAKLPQNRTGEPEHSPVPPLSAASITGPLFSSFVKNECHHGVRLTKFCKKCMDEDRKADDGY
jgi:hypothetical protein